MLKHDVWKGQIIFSRDNYGCSVLKLLILHGTGFRVCHHPEERRRQKVQRRRRVGRPRVRQRRRCRHRHQARRIRQGAGGANGFFLLQPVTGSCHSA